MTMLATTALSKKAWMLRDSETPCGLTTHVVLSHRWERMRHGTRKLSLSHGACKHCVLKTEESYLLCKKLDLQHCGEYRVEPRTWELPRLPLNCLSLSL